jgi:repressor LexA
MRAIAQKVRDGVFEFDLIVVTGRIRAGRGFAAISQAANQTLELEAAGDGGLGELCVGGDLGQGLGIGGELRLRAGRSASGFLVYPFNSHSVPIFTHTIQVKQSLWNRLMPGDYRATWVVDPAGHRTKLDKLLANLSHLPPEARRYDPQRSAMTPSELASMAVEDLFEEVGTESTVATELPEQPNPYHVLTWRQRKILQVIRDSIQHRGYPPSRREIGEAVGLTSTASVLYQLSVLQRNGYVRWESGRPRSLVVQVPGRPALRPDEGTPHQGPGEEQPPMDIASHEATYVPIVGRIAAGGPILADQAVEDVFPLPRELVGEGTLFLLRIVGDSMINAAITDGDLVVVRAQDSAENGEIVAAMLDGEATVKTFKHSSDGNSWLVPHNPAYRPIAANDATILGKVVAVLRQI